MKTKILHSPDADAGTARAAVTIRTPVRLTRWRTLMDFRSRSVHLRAQQPGARIGHSLLRDVVVALVFATLVNAQPACGGTITGTVSAEGKAGTEKTGGGDAYGSRKFKFLRSVDYTAMRDFVVFIDGVTLTNLPTTNITHVTTLKVAQSGAVFSPHVLPVLAGTTVEWPNHDDIYHNVFSVSDAAQFDLGLYKGSPPEKRVIFAQPGKADVYCSIHADMHCIVLVMSNPYFATTDKDGRYTIPNVPPGKYKLKAWHERLPVDVQEITVPETGEVSADFTLTIKNLPKI
jgi:plastocyanin